jgi:hypothetical protein
MIRINHPVVDDQQIYVSEVAKYGTIRGYYGIIENLLLCKSKKRDKILLNMPSPECLGSLAGRLFEMLYKM